MCINHSAIVAESGLLGADMRLGLILCKFLLIVKIFLWLLSADFMAQISSCRFYCADHYYAGSIVRILDFMCESFLLCGFYHGFYCVSSYRANSLVQIASCH